MPGFGSETPDFRHLGTYIAWSQLKRVGPGRILLPVAWLEQWERVNRWHRRVVLSGTTFRSDNPVGSSEAYRDELIAFFDAVNHLRDWIREDDALQLAADEPGKSFNSSLGLVVARSISVGNKHVRINDPKLHPDTRHASTGVQVLIGPGGGVKMSWSILSDGKEHDAVELADECVAAWRKILVDLHLLSPE